jgi:hypothetical protein
MGNKRRIKKDLCKARDIVENKKINRFKLKVKVKGEK